MNTIPDNWYETFFAGINCDMWRKAGTEEWTNNEVSFINDVLNLPSGSRILDMPCGTGRHSVMLARQGFRVTAVDISEEYITTLQKRVDEEDLPVQVIHANMITVSLADKYDGAFCFGNSFGYFNHKHMQSFLQNVSAALKPGAKWIINSGLMAESFLAKFIRENTYQLPGLTMHVFNEYDEWESCLLTTLTYTKDDREEVHRFKHYVHTTAEVIRWLASAGLQTVTLYNSTNMETYHLGDAQVYLVAEKK